MICKTCKYWCQKKNKHPADLWSEGHGICERILEDEQAKFAREEKAFIHSYYSEWTALQTHKTFGCALWEKK